MSRANLGYYEYQKAYEEYYGSAPMYDTSTEQAQECNEPVETKVLTDYHTQYIGKVVVNYYPNSARRCVHVNGYVVKNLVNKAEAKAIANNPDKYLIRKA